MRAYSRQIVKNSACPLLTPRKLRRTTGALGFNTTPSFCEIARNAYAAGCPTRLVAAGRGGSSGSADDSQLPAASASAEELIAAIGLESRYAYSRRQFEP